MQERVLLVDDDGSLLLGVRRRLSPYYQVDVAESGSSALDLLRKNEPYAAIISDYRMPGMDGITLLARVMESDPLMVRILLTGHVDVEMALEAINRGQIFRFLTKPTRDEDLLRTVQDAVQYYRAVTQERDMVKKTLAGSVKLLTGVFALANPQAYGQAVRIGLLARKIAERLALDKPWELELAALLSQIGTLALPPPLLDKVQAERKLTEEESRMYHEHPFLGYRLLANIPRLEEIASGVQYQLANYDGSGSPPPDLQGSSIPLLGRLLKVVIDYDRLVEAGWGRGEACGQLQARESHYDPEVLAALESEIMELERGYTIKSIRVSELEEGMTLADDIRASNDVVLAAGGQVASEILVTRLRNFSSFGVIREPIKIVVMVRA